MSKAIQRLNELLREGRIVSVEMFEGVSTDALLDGRDEAAFDGEWMRVHEGLTRQRDGREEPAGVTSIREAAYLRVFELTEDPELAACVSDDFGLLAGALAVGYEDPWLTGLWLSYRQGVFPRGNVGRDARALESTI